MRTFRAGDVEVTERGAGPAILLVHAGGSTGSAWNRVADLLADRFRVLVYDRPTYRGADPLRGAEAMAAEVADLRTVADAVGEPVLVVGHSSGAGGRPAGGTGATVRRAAAVRAAGRARPADRRRGAPTGAGGTRPRRPARGDAHPRAGHRRRRPVRRPGLPVPARRRADADRARGRADRRRRGAGVARRRHRPVRRGRRPGPAARRRAQPGSVARVPRRAGRRPPARRAGRAAEAGARGHGPGAGEGGGGDRRLRRPRALRSVGDTERDLPVLGHELLVGVGHRAAAAALDGVLRRVVRDGDTHGPDAAEAEVLAVLGQRRARQDRALLVGDGDRHARGYVAVAPVAAGAVAAAVGVEQAVLDGQPLPVALEGEHEGARDG